MFRRSKYMCALRSIKYKQFAKRYCFDILHFFLFVLHIPTNMRIYLFAVN
jgi:hypothetical protein